MAYVSRRKFLIGTAAFAIGGRAWAEEGLTLSNARILVGDGTETKGGIRVRGGKIEAVGPEVTGGEDLGGAIVYPGIYVAGCPLGLWEVDLEAGSRDDGEGRDAIVPTARAVDGYNPASEVIPVCRVGGIVGALVTPTRGLVAGQAAWMRTFGDTVADATIAAPAAVCFGLGRAGTGLPGGPTSRLGVASAIRDLFDANRPPEPAAEDGKKKKKAAEPDKKDEPTRAQKVLHALWRRETKAIFAAERESDVRIALELIAELGLDGMILGGAEAWAAADAIAAAKVPVLLGPVTTQPSGFDTFRATYENAARLHAAGVKIALRVGGPHNARDLTTEAGIAVSYGLPWAAGIAALSGNGPALWNLDVGLVKPGHEATFVLTDGDPLEPRTRVRRFWGRGAEIPLRSRQTELFERFRVLR